MDSDHGYLRRLAEIDMRVALGQPSPDVVCSQAAGLLAGRVGCRIDDAHAHLRELAAEQGRDVAAVAADLIAALEPRESAPSVRLRMATGTVLRPSAEPAGPAAPEAAPVAGGWGRLVQQLLDAVPGRHIAVEPLRDDAGRVVDYRITAVSPSVVDISGRSSAQMVGLHPSEVYPSVVGSPVWDAWRDTLADGRPREVGPYPYVGAPHETPAGMSLMVRVHPLGAGLLNSWVRLDEETRLAERLAQTERLGGLGWGEWDLVRDTITWSAELYRIYEREPADGPMPREETDALTLPEDEHIRQRAAGMYARGQTIDVTYRIRIHDKIKHVRMVADAVRDLNGRPLKIYGILQDVTARETSRAQLAEVQQQLREQRQSLAAEHRLARQLQQIVLPIPTAPIDLPGLRVAVRYLPAEQASNVGGDWYHAAPGRDGCLILAVGDVAGHGVQAAATMAQLRHALAALATTTTTDPAALLGHLNEVLYAAGPAAGTATAVVVRYDPTTHAVTWAQAGHPAPLLARAGTTTELFRPAGALLGAVRHARYATAGTTLAVGDLLLLYTDGLIEQRSHTLAEGLAPVTALLDRVTAHHRPQPLAELLGALHQANPDDDTCILAARRHTPADRNQVPPSRP